MDVYYIHAFAANGVFLGDRTAFVQETAQLRPVPGGIDEPLPRVTAHELGHALGLAAPPGPDEPPRLGDDRHDPQPGRGRPRPRPRPPDPRRPTVPDLRRRRDEAKPAPTPPRPPAWPRSSARSPEPTAAKPARAPDREARPCVGRRGRVRQRGRKLGPVEPRLGRSPSPVGIASSMSMHTLISQLKEPNQTKIVLLVADGLGGLPDRAGRQDRAGNRPDPQPRPPRRRRDHRPEHPRRPRDHPRLGSRAPRPVRLRPPGPRHRPRGPRSPRDRRRGRPERRGDPRELLHDQRRRRRHRPPRRADPHRDLRPAGREAPRRGSASRGSRP